MKIGSIKSTDGQHTYVVSRHGKRKNQGGGGIVWSCTCDQFVRQNAMDKLDERGGKAQPCRHLLSLWAGDLPYWRLRLTQDGERILFRYGQNSKPFRKTALLAG